MYLINRISKAIIKRLIYLKLYVIWWIGGAGRNIQKLFYNRHAGGDCVIICNGPSIANVDFKTIQHLPTFALNRAYLAFDEWGFQPTYYVCVNELVLSQFSEDIDSLKMPKFINFSKKQLFTSYNTYPILLRFRDKYCKSFCEPVSVAATVTFVAIQTAMLMGFRRIFIIGLDHSFVGDGKPNQTLISQEEDQNHFLKNYFAGGVLWEYPDLKRNESGYKLLRAVAEQREVEIIDCTDGGKCPVFQKGRIEDYLGSGKDGRT